MKSLLILILFSLSLSAFGGWASKKMLSECKSEVWTSALCQSKHSDCVKVPKNFNCETFVEIDELVDDFDNPNWGARSMIGPCVGEEDCIEKALALVCIDGRTSYYNEEYNEIWCNKILSYSKKATGNKLIVEDEAKKLSYDEAKLAKDTQDAAVQMVLKAMNKGREIIAIMGIRNNAKGLSVGQVKQFLTNFGNVKAMLESGALATAKEEIESLTPDNIIVTQEDKDAILSEINSFLGL